MVRVVLVELMLESLVWPRAAAGRVEDVGEVALEVAGLRAVVVAADVEVVDLGLAAAVDVVLDMAEVRRAAVPRVEVRRLSSSDTDDVERCAEEAVVEVRLVAVELAAGRVGGLLSPPVAVPVRVVEVGVGFVAVEVVPGRRAAVVVEAGFFEAVTVPVLETVEAGFFAGAAVEGALDFSAEGSAGGSSATGASTGASAGASSCWTTSYPSASDIIAWKGFELRAAMARGGKCLSVSWVNY